MKRKTFAVDWDGVLVEYNGYRGVGIYGSPVIPMVNQVKEWLNAGHEVIIHTSRVSVEHPIDTALDEIEAITNVLTQMNLPKLEVTANKYTRVSEFWDDRAVRVLKNKGYRENLGSI